MQPKNIVTAKTPAQRARQVHPCFTGQVFGKPCPWGCGSENIFMGHGTVRHCTSCGMSWGKGEGATLRLQGLEAPTKVTEFADQRTGRKIWPIMCHECGNMFDVYDDEVPQSMKDNNYIDNEAEMDMLWDRGHRHIKVESTIMTEQNVADKVNALPDDIRKRVKRGAKEIREAQDLPERLRMLTGITDEEWAAAEAADDAGEEVIQT